jgi:hypothetical protein
MVLTQLIQSVLYQLASSIPPKYNLMEIIPLAFVFALFYSSTYVSSKEAVALSVLSMATTRGRLLWEDSMLGDEMLTVRPGSECG